MQIFQLTHLSPPAPSLLSTTNELMLTIQDGSSCLSLLLSIKHKFKRFKVVSKRKYHNAGFVIFKAVFIITTLKIAESYLYRLQNFNYYSYGDR